MTRTATFLLGLLTMAPAWADDAQKIVGCMRANVPPHLVIGRVVLTSFDRGGGARTVTGRLFTRRDGGGPAALMQATLRIDGPAELRGAAYHVRETQDYLRDGMFVYLPAVRRVRRITGSFADGSLLGTDFSYFDFKQLQNAFGDLAATLEPAEPINGRPAHVLRFRALEGTETRYSGARAWIDREACVAVRAEFLEGNKVVKELSSPEGSLKRAGKVWYVSQIEMREPAAGTRTVLLLGRLDADAAPPARLFDPTSFYLGP